MRKVRERAVREQDAQRGHDVSGPQVRHFIARIYSRSLGCEWVVSSKRCGVEVTRFNPFLGEGNED